METVADPCFQITPLDELENLWQQAKAQLAKVGTPWVEVSDDEKINNC